MNRKFQRNYRLTIETGQEIQSIDLATGKAAGFGADQALVIGMPTTAQFRIERGASASYNQMQIVLYNLSEDDRSKIFMDRFIYTKPMQIILEAGYGDYIYTVFVGTIRQASSARAGTEIVTVINAQDGGYDLTTTQSNKTIAAGTPFTDLLKSLIGDFPNINQGVVTGPDGVTKRPTVLNGNTLALLKRHSDERVFVDLGTAHVMNDNQCFQGDAVLIDSDTGLLETPRRDDANLSITTIFEPRLVVGQAVEVRSDVQKQYNGQYKVLGIRHDCIMSGAVGGQCTSTFTLFSPALVNSVLEILPNPASQQVPQSSATP